MKSADVSSPHSYASVPTPFTRFMRTFIPYQLVRFAVINLKMLRVLSKAHTRQPRDDVRRRP